MSMSRIHKRVPKLLKTIAQIDHSVLISPVVHEKTTSVQDPSFVSIKYQCFSCSRLQHNPKASLNESTSSLATRRYRNARTVGQGVLFDYLHCTRYLSISDAEHISKNSPKFLKKLLSKIDTEKGVANALTRFLRYNPINEFEPFFESLGLSPSELPLVLPRHLMYLSDDPVMFENFRALCDYGIPRSNIGKMYKEAREIFQYDYGVLALKLRACEDVGLSKATVIELVSCCPLLLKGSVKYELVKFVEKLKLLGLGMDWIGEYASDNNTLNWNRMLDTVYFLDNVGFTVEQMCTLLKKNLASLLQGSGKNVYVLFGRLLKLGLDMNDVYSLCTQYQQVFSVKCTNNLLQAIDFLIEAKMGTDEIADVVANNMEFLCSSSLKRTITAVSRELEIGRDGVLQSIREDPVKVLKLASKSEPITSKPNKFLEKSSFLLSLGFVESSEEMMKAMKYFRVRGDQLQERFDCLVEAGLDRNVVTNIVKQAPRVLRQSKDSIMKNVHVLVGRLLELGLDMNDVYSLCTQHPQVLSAKWAKNLLQAIDFLIEVEMGTDEIADVVANNMEFLCSSSLKRTITAVSRELEIGRDGVLQIIREDPGKVLKLTSKSEPTISKPNNFLEKSSFFLSLGYVERSEEMMKAMKYFRVSGDRLQERFDCLVEAGLDRNVVTNIVKQAPLVLRQSKDSILKNVYVLVCRLLELGLDLSDIYSLCKQHPQVFSPKWAKNLLQAIDFLIEVEMGTGEIADVVANNIEFLCSSRLRRPITVSKELEVGTNGLLQIIREDQGKVLILSSRRSKVTTSKQVGVEAARFGRDLKKHMKMSFLLRLGYAENSDEMMKLLTKLGCSSADEIQERFDCLVEAGFDFNFVANMVKQAPSFLNVSKDLIVKKVSFLLRLGYAKNSEEMMKAFMKFKGRGDQLQERFDCLVEAGLDRNVVTNIVKEAPQVLNRRKDIIVKKLSFLKCLGYPLETVAAVPNYLCYDMTRTRLRMTMFSWLRKKRGVSPVSDAFPKKLMSYSDAQFKRYHVDIHPEGPAMWESLKKQYAELQLDL